MVNFMLVNYGLAFISSWQPFQKLDNRSIALKKAFQRIQLDHPTAQDHTQKISVIGISLRTAETLAANIICFTTEP